MEQGENKLDVDMSQLEISENKAAVDIEAQNNISLRRSNRRKNASEESSEKKRVLQKPKKLSADKELKQIVNYYLDRKIKRTSSCLETIFEIPKGESYMTTRKFARILPPKDITKPKNRIKKKNMKFKRHKSKKLSMDLLIQKLTSVETDS